MLPCHVTDSDVFKNYSVKVFVVGYSDLNAQPSYDFIL